MSKMVPCLWFDHQAETAARFYVSIFKNSRILKTSYYGDAGPGPKGSVLTVTFRLNGQEFMALNGGPRFPFTEAVSFVVSCGTQHELDRFWERLSKGGQEAQCGWLKDQFGLSWQIVPKVLSRMMTDKDARRRERVMQAVVQMKKLEIAVLKRAYAGQ
jgi:predicted 3-demethylubiquinone-9 3-methyltransferase (glyoxalase superfamily)